MKSIESTVIGKKSNDTCEDGLVVTDDFIAVIDGSTSKTPHHLHPDMKNGRFAMTLVAEYVRHLLNADATVDDFCQGVTIYINKVYEDRGVKDYMLHHPEERLTASAVLYSKTRNEVWMVGDCQALVGGQLYDNGKPYEQEIAMRRVELIRQGFSPADARKRIEPQLVQEMLLGQNKSYAVIDGFPILRQGVVVVPVQKGARSTDVVLATDGYPFLMPTLRESEEALARQLANDPQNIRQFIATKGLVEGNCSFDDRAYVRFIV